MQSAFEKMDLMYRYQRHFYDATRKYYLIGRDRLLDKIKISPGQSVAEIGCGTARNLSILAARHPENKFYGVDASSTMLVTARSNLATLGINNISLHTALADDFNYLRTFGLRRPVDVIFFSYSISMIQTWKASIRNALDNLSPGGRLYIVDFYDQRELPRSFRWLLAAWLRRFHVQFWSELIPFLFEIDRSGQCSLELESVGRRYAFIATLEKN